MGSRMNRTVSAAQVQDLARSILQEQLRFVDSGPKCTVGNLFLVLFFAAARAASIFDACRRLGKAPCDQAVRNALSAWSPKMEELERRLNLALQARLPKGLFRKNRPMAIDQTQVPYYGQPFKDKRELCRGKPKAGTTRFHCYATLYVVRKGQRFTIALTYVWANDSHLAVVKRLLQEAARIGLRPRYLLLDRGFYGLEVVKHLKSIHCPFLLPVAHRGRASKRPLSQWKGTRRFLAWKRSGFSRHLMRNRQQETTVNICVACMPKSSRRGQRKVRPRVFAYWGLRPVSPAWVRQAYRKRYGIETSYRQMNQGRIITCTRDPRIRLLLVGIALVLRNIWVWLHYAILGRRCGQGIQLHLELLRLRTMLLLLQRCAEARLGRTENARDGPGATCITDSP